MALKASVRLNHTDASFSLMSSVITIKHQSQFWALSIWKFRRLYMNYTILQNNGSFHNTKQMMGYCRCLGWRYYTKQSWWYWRKLAWRTGFNILWGYLDPTNNNNAFIWKIKFYLLSKDGTDLLRVLENLNSANCFWVWFTGARIMLGWKIS